MYRYTQELELPAGSQVVKISGGKEHALVLLKTSEHLERILPQHQENDGRVLVMGAGDHGGAVQVEFSLYP